MDLREEVFSHEEKLWVMCLGESAHDEPLPPLFDCIDWYNNQILTRTLLGDKIDLSLGSKTLLATSGQLPVSRLLIFGLGRNLEKLDGKSILSELDKALQGLNETNPWIIIPPELPQDVLNQLHKQQPHFKNLTQANFSV